MSVPNHVFEQTLAELFSPIGHYLRTDDVTEVLINRYDEIFIERHGMLERTASAFPSEFALMAALRNLSQYVGRELSGCSPILEARLPDGSRVEAIIPPAAPNGPAISIRRFNPKQLTLERLMELDAVAAPVAKLLRIMVRSRSNVIVSGGSGTGKTSVLNALAGLMNAGERVIVIEDSQELQLALPHVVHLEAQPGDSQGRGAISIRQLFRATLRMRPDRIVIGEIRGGEALELVQAMTSGHRGCLSTVHGTAPAETLGRLETMALMGDVDIPVSVLRRQIASAVDHIVQVARNEKGLRQVTQVVRVLGFDAEEGYRLEQLFTCDNLDD